MFAFLFVFEFSERQRQRQRQIQGKNAYIAIAAHSPTRNPHTEICAQLKLFESHSLKFVGCFVCVCMYVCVTFE